MQFNYLRYFKSKETKEIELDLVKWMRLSSMARLSLKSLNIDRQKFY